MSDKQQIDALRNEIWRARKRRRFLTLAYSLEVGTVLALVISKQVSWRGMSAILGCDAALAILYCRWSERRLRRMLDGKRGSLAELTLTTIRESGAKEATA